tara:strand:+ start:1207 stop:1836 length:630 start_codon:yes stop_codon:yes gene_type:complete
MEIVKKTYSNNWHCDRMFTEFIVVQELQGLSDRLNIRNSKYMNIPGNQVKGLHNDEYFLSLKHWSTQIANEVFERVYNYDMTNLDVEMTSMWLNKNPKGAFHTPHYHANNMLSGVYFPEGDGEDFAQLCFMRPHNMQLLPESAIKSWNSFNAYEWHCKVKKDILVLFPSYLNHYVDSNYNEKERLSIAFDFLIRGEYSDKGDGVTKHTI